MKKFKGLKNFRDLGGIRTSDGRKVKRGILFRSDCLFKATKEDCGLLSGLIHNIIDLRTNLEIEEKPDALVPGVRNIPIPVFTESVIGITRDTGSDYSSFIRHSHDRKAIRAIIPDMNEIYSYVMSDKMIVEKMGEALRKIVDNVIEGRRTLFHCSQGKDRAGAVAALTLSLLGVGREEVFEDYERTNKVLRPKAVLDSVLVCLLKLDPVAARKVYRASIADRSYIKASYDTIDRIYGSVEEFFRKAVGITDELRDRFRAAALSI